jgi:hypothetical protein
MQVELCSSCSPASGLQGIDIQVELHNFSPEVFSLHALLNCSPQINLIPCGIDMRVQLCSSCGPASWLQGTEMQLELHNPIPEVSSLQELPSCSPQGLVNLQYSSLPFSYSDVTSREDDDVLQPVRYYDGLNEIVCWLDV